jgi:hypothetical protein
MHGSSWLAKNGSLVVYVAAGRHGGAPTAHLITTEAQNSKLPEHNRAVVG